MARNPFELSVEIKDMYADRNELHSKNTKPISITIIIKVSRFVVSHVVKIEATIHGNYLETYSQNKLLTLKPTINNRR